jgi:hypothetical protein
MDIDSAPLSPVPFSCTGQRDEKRTSSWVVSMSIPQQCCLRSRSSSCRVDLPPRRRTFFVIPRPNTGDISDNKGNIACPPNQRCTHPPFSFSTTPWINSSVRGPFPPVATIGFIDFKVHQGRGVKFHLIISLESYVGKKLQEA